MHLPLSLIIRSLSRFFVLFLFLSSGRSSVVVAIAYHRSYPSYHHHDPPWGSILTLQPSPTSPSDLIYLSFDFSRPRNAPPLILYIFVNISITVCLKNMIIIILSLYSSGFWFLSYSLIVPCRRRYTSICSDPFMGFLHRVPLFSTIILRGDVRLTHPIFTLDLCGCMYVYVCPYVYGLSRTSAEIGRAHV